MLARSVTLVVLLAAPVTGCGGDATPPPQEPVRPAPIVAWAPPAVTAPPRRVEPARPASPAATTTATPARVPAPPSEPGQRCVLDGIVEFAPNTPIQNTEGRVIGRFSGGASHVALTELTFGSTPRAQIVTGNARGTFRLRGFVAASDVPLFTTASVPVAAGHLAIAEHRRVALTSVSPDKLKIEHAAAPPLGQTFTAWTTCNALSLVPGTPSGWSPPGDARGYALRRDSLELLDAPNGAAVGVVRRAPGAPSVLFFGGEQSAGFVHVERHTDVDIDAWVRANDVAALPRGETMDQAEPPVTTAGAPHLALATEPRVVRSTREVALRSETRELSPPIGVIGADTETYVIDVMAGWASVMPKAMDVIPPDGGAFWVKKSELGL
ncbi:MAG TPA: hypothetical protein VMI54_27705 [Polyangiaceae bacterium]|nr:hypothetical protein [Polyangiaceae bacterium]